MDAETKARLDALEKQGAEIVTYLQDRQIHLDALERLTDNASALTDRVAALEKRSRVHLPGAILEIGDAIDAFTDRVAVLERMMELGEWVIVPFKPRYDVNIDITEGGPQNHRSLANGYEEDAPMIGDGAP